MAAILVGGLKCRTQIWKETTQGSFQQSLVEIGSVVSEEKIFFKFHPAFFLFLT
jgi:UV DNA damage repair endonuclease